MLFEGRVRLHTGYRITSTTTDIHAQIVTKKACQLVPSSYHSNDDLCKIELLFTNKNTDLLTNLQHTCINKYKQSSKEVRSYLKEKALSAWARPVLLKKKIQ